MTVVAVDVGPAEIETIPELARIWHDGWHDAHAAIMPELVSLRTRRSFQERLPALLADTRVAGPRWAPVGMCILKADELYQLYVAREARGAGVAQALIADAERLLRERGVSLAWLTCAIGNDRAARFYEKSGWIRAGTMPYRAETSSGPYEVDVWRYEKRL